jgi:hypothetical protein
MTKRCAPEAKLARRDFQVHMQVHRGAILELVQHHFSTPKIPGRQSFAKKL